MKDWEVQFIRDYVCLKIKADLVHFMNDYAFKIVINGESVIVETSTYIRRIVELEEV